jgi:hypothetical protein
MELTEWCTTFRQSHPRRLSGNKLRDDLRLFAFEVVVGESDRKLPSRVNFAKEQETLNKTW